MIYFKNSINREALFNECQRVSTEIKQVTDNILERHNSIKILDHTPQILQDVGCPDLPILFSQSHVRNCLHPKGRNPHWHGLQKSTLENLPFLLSEPALIYDSLTSEDSIVLVLNEQDSDNLPIIASLTPNGSGQYLFEKLNSNYLTSVYGKNNLTDVLKRAYEADFILYLDMEKSQELHNLAGLQLPWGLCHTGFDIIVHKSNNIVNTYINESSRPSYAIEALSASGRIIIEERPGCPALGKDEQQEICMMHMSRNIAGEIIGCRISGANMSIISAYKTGTGEIAISETNYIRGNTAIKHFMPVCINKPLNSFLKVYGYELSGRGTGLKETAHGASDNDRTKTVPIDARLAGKKAEVKSQVKGKTDIERPAASCEAPDL